MDSAAFVDVVHTDGSLTPAVVWIIPRAGDLHAMGHMDFYPQELDADVLSCSNRHSGRSNVNNRHTPRENYSIHTNIYPF